VVPADRWPKQLVVGIVPWDGLAADRERWERQLGHAVVEAVARRNGRVVPLTPSLREALERERAPIQPVRRLSSERGDPAWLVGVDVLLVESGDVLDSMSWDVPEAARDGALEAVIGRVAQLLAAGGVSDS
jgi:hypothetical protein